MKLNQYHLELGATAACTKRFMEEMKVMGQRALKWSIWDCFLFYSWFFSKKLVEEDASIGVDFVGIVKTNIKRCCMATVEGLTKICPGRSYIVLRSKPVVPGESPLLSIGDKYKSQKVL